jgi:predicted RNA-binding protein with PIN domain
VLVVDAANVVGSRANGWWRDRPKAAREFCDELAAAVDAGRISPPVVVVLEGQARRGSTEREGDGLRIVHAPATGDDTITAISRQEVAGGCAVTVVTADRGLQERVRRAGAGVVSPRWLLDRL